MSEERSTGVPLAAWIAGSDSDLKFCAKGFEIFREFGVPFEVRILSAHRTPHALEEYVTSAQDKGIKIFVACAGGAAHLAGTVAAKTLLPVIGVPIPSTDLGGMDALLSTVQMPAGVPVASMAIGNAGAANAALFAIRILAVSDNRLARNLAEYRRKAEEKVLEKDKAVAAEFRTKS